MIMAWDNIVYLLGCHLTYYNSLVSNTESGIRIRWEPVQSYNANIQCTLTRSEGYFLMPVMHGEKKEVL